MQVWHGLVFTGLVIRYIRPNWFKWSLLTVLALVFGISG